MPDVNDTWAAGATYEDFMGRWSRLLAPRFVSWLSVRPAAHWLDVGCGTGALAGAVCAGADPASVVACDPSEPFIEYARRGRVDSRASFVVAGVGGLPTRPGGFGSVSSLLALNFFPTPESAVDEMRRLTAANGLVSACVWDYAGRMELLRFFWDSVAAVDAGAGALDEGRRFPICRPEALEVLFREAGLADVVCEPIEIPMEFPTFAELWKPSSAGRVLLRPMLRASTFRDARRWSRGSKVRFPGRPTAPFRWSPERGPSAESRGSTRAVRRAESGRAFAFRRCPPALRPPDEWVMTSGSC